MTLRINSNISAINAHRNLQINETNLSKSLERLSSGLKIIRASDGPASLVISEQMRSQVKGLEQAIRNAETDIAMIQTTESSLEEVNRILISLRQLAVHAANDAVNDDLMLEADQKEWDNSLAALNRIAKDTQFGMKKLLDGSGSANGIVSGDPRLEFLEASASTKQSDDLGYDVVITQVATQAIAGGGEKLTQEIIEDGERLLIAENGKSIEYTTKKTDTINSVVQQLQSAVDQRGLDVTVGVTDETLFVTHDKYGKDYDIQVLSSTAGILSEESNELNYGIRGVDIQGMVGGDTMDGSGQVLRGIEGSANTDGLVLRYRGTAGLDAGEIDLPEEGRIIGTLHIRQNSLRFHLGANADENVGVSLGSVGGNKLGTGIDNESGFNSIEDVDLRSFEGANDALRLIGSSIDSISSLRATLGSFQKNNLESNLFSLRVARENMIASESVIRDVDVAEEVIGLTKAKMLVKSSTALLAQADQSYDSVLQLLE